MGVACLFSFTILIWIERNFLTTRVAKMEPLVKTQISQTKTKNRQRTQSGFTLTELLVVVAVLALLILATFRLFNRDVDKARDAQRKKDLKELKLAMEDYYNDHGSYPPDEYFVVENCGTDILAPYLKRFPCDPTSGQPYLYLPVENGGYRILARLFNSADPVIEELGCTGGCLTDYPDYNYGIAEGVPLSNNDHSNSAPLPSPLNCTSTTCFCCNATPGNTADCTLYAGSGYCGAGPYASSAQCYANSTCRAN